MSMQSESLGRHSKRHGQLLVEMMAVWLDEIKGCYSSETSNDITKVL